ncbi:MAG: solute-binding protein [Desulfatitalea sp.]|nr:substrate-binding domain-containing protein [Desulfatitalea sp.]NNJ99795.1 solute-binding protein [Desulfatitalea sp.]
MNATRLGAKWTLVMMIACLMLLASAAWAEAPRTLMLATTTSTDNTGLLDELAPFFTKATGIELRWRATGTGNALELGKNCDVDVLLVHAPSAEKAYIANGYGIKRRQIMYNDFVIIGPQADPAGIKGKPVVEALSQIAAKASVFVSRDDNSGTNKKEIALWQLTHLSKPDKQHWYVQAGQGMLATINVAAERMGYTLTDRGTYIKYAHVQGGHPPLKVLVAGDPELRNQYSIVEVNPARCANARNDLAHAFSQWMAGAEAQKRIGEFKLLDEALFIPNSK